MENPGIEYTDKQRWFALTKINTLSVLSQVVQIGTITPLLSLSLEQQNVEPAKIGGLSAPHGSRSCCYTKSFHDCWGSWDWSGPISSAPH